MFDIMPGMLVFSFLLTNPKPGNVSENVLIRKTEDGTHFEESS